MAFYLEGKTSVSTNDLSPKEATQMSYDVKYIGYIELDIADILNVTAVRLKIEQNQLVRVSE